MMKSILWLLPAVVGLAAGCDARVVEADLPDYYEEYLSARMPVVKEAAGQSSDCFFFWTDSHLEKNDGYAPEMIRYVGSRLKRFPKTFFGGDAIPAFTDDITPFIDAYRSQCGRVMECGRLYQVHGNHDFTFKYKPGGEGLTFDLDTTAALLQSVMSPEGVVRNPDDPHSNYYYLDEPKARIRYIVLDSSDSVKDTHIGFGLVDSVGPVQRRWIFSEAIMKAPRAYSLIVLVHVPQLACSTGGSTPEMEAALGALATHRRYRVDGAEYRFDLRPDLKLLAVLAGHNHHDMQMFKEGVLHIHTAADARYRDFRRDPYATLERRVSGTVDAQAIDWVCVSRRHDVLRLLRLGYGPDRIFHLEPIVLQPDESYQVPIEAVRWDIYDTGSALKKKENEKYAYYWDLSRQVASVDPAGRVTALAPGDATLLCEKADGTREFYYICCSK